jgi:phosphoribosylpyrophosphate synthetase
MTNAEKFWSEIEVAGNVMDPPRVHTEFVDGMHGQKVDFDGIKETDPLYHKWVGVNVDAIKAMCDPLPEVIIGVANGTNRLAHSVASKLEGQSLALETYKDPNDFKKVYLTNLARTALSGINPELAVIVEDVGTTGSTSVQVARQALDAGAWHVLVINTLQRREQLEKLKKAGVPHHAIIKKILPTFTPEDCNNLPEGFCHRGWELHERAS